MKNNWMMIACLAVALLSAGCGSGPDKSAFNNTAPELKQIWDKAIAANQANDYVAASTNYVALLRQGISADQTAAVQSALRSLNQRLQTAVAKGDATAQKAVEDLKKLSGTSNRPGRPSQP